MLKYTSLLFLILSFIACSEEVPQKRPKAATGNAVEKPVDNTADAVVDDSAKVDTESDSEVEKGDTVEKSEDSLDDEKILHSLNLDGGVCQFAIENQTKSKACEMLLDEGFSDCLLDIRSAIHGHACEGDKTFQEALEIVL